MPIDEIKLDDKVSAPQAAVGKDPLKMPTTKKNLRPVFLIVGAVLAVIIVVSVLVAIQVQGVIANARASYEQAKQIYVELKNQDLVKTDAQIVQTKKKVADTRASLNKLAWVGFVPFAGGYVSDGQHLLNAADDGLDAADILVKAALPYVDLLGLKGQGSFTGGTTEERIQKMVETLGKVSPEIDKVADKLDLVKKEFDQVDPNRYPESFRGTPVRSRLVQARDTLDAVDSFLSQARPMVKKLPDLLGATNEQKYMILFQNDGELRPTGGFITAYAIFNIDKGKISLDSSDDIYKLDDTITKHVTPPDPISRYLNVFGWRLRDANFSPDFNSSMHTFEDLYNSSPQKKPIAGIIAVDTHVLFPPWLSSPTKPSKCALIDDSV